MHFSITQITKYWLYIIMAHDVLYSRYLLNCQLALAKLFRVKTSLII